MIIPGILESSLQEIDKKIKLIESVAKIIQIDVADGILVNGKSLSNPALLCNLSSKTELELHLMVKDPIKYLKYEMPFKKVSSQIEAEGIPEFIVEAKKLGLKTGLSLNSETEISHLEPYLNSIDFVQFMGIEPGAQGRHFKNAVYEKISSFKKAYPNMEIQVDGNVTNQNIKKLVMLGVDNVIVGSAIFSSPNPLLSFEELKKSMD